MGRVKRIWYLSPMRAAKVQASLRIRQKARSLAPLNGWACAVKICHDGMLEDTNSLDAAQMRMDDKILHLIMNAYFDNITFIIS